jgi:restriction system protein
MDPIAFEWLIRALLLRVGYTNVLVTPPSNDFGIDVTATLDAGGIAEVETAIQAKRTAVVGRPAIQNLRGSLAAHQAGLFITSGRFAQNAIEEAGALGRQRIALLDGARLAELLLKHDIATRKRSVTIHALALADLELDVLREIAEGESQ